MVFFLVCSVIFRFTLRMVNVNFVVFVDIRMVVVGNKWQLDYLRFVSLGWNLVVVGPCLANPWKRHPPWER